MQFFGTHIFLPKWRKKAKFLRAKSKITRMILLAFKLFTRREFYSHISKIRQNTRFLLAFFHFLLALLFLAFFFLAFFPRMREKNAYAKEKKKPMS